MNLEEPSEQLLANWIRYHKQKTIGKTHITFADLEFWCMKRLSVPEDIHTPFVIGYDIYENEDDPKKVHFMYQYIYNINSQSYLKY